MSIKRYPYTCQTCGIKMQRAYMKAFGAKCLCTPCYAKEIQIALGEKYQVKEGAL